MAMDIQEAKEVESQKVVAGIIYSDDRKSVLVGRRAKGKPFAGKWEFIGGKVEKGERLDEAIKREVWEETLLGVLPLSPLGEARFTTSEGLDIDVTFFECDVRHGSLAEINRNPKVHTSFRWVRIGDLPNMDWVGANADFAKWFVEYERKRLT